MATPPSSVKNSRRLMRAKSIRKAADLAVQS